MRIQAVLAFLFLSAAAAAQRGPAAASSISGTLSFKDGTPAAGVRVSALDAGGGPNGTVAMMSIESTDGQGRFRLDVPPGKYVIGAGPLEAATYFPGTPTQADARIVEVGAGAAMTGINFRLTTVRVRGRILWQDFSTPDAPPSIPARFEPASPPILQVRFRGSNSPFRPNPDGRDMVPVARDGSFEFSTLRPDSYRIELFPTVRMPEMRIAVQDEDISDYRIVLPYVVTVTGMATSDEDAPRPLFELTFSDINRPPPQRPATGGDRIKYVGGPRDVLAVEVTAQVAGLIAVQVPTGVHRVTVTGLSRGYEVKSMTAGAVDLMSNPLTVSAAGVPPIRIVLGVLGTPHWPTIRGRISGRGSWSRGLSVFGPASTTGVSFIGPDASMVYSQAFQRSTVFFLDGSFEIPRLLPGRYLIRDSSSQGLGQDSPVEVLDDDVNDVVITVSDTDAPTASGPADGPRVRGRIAGRAKAVPEAVVRLTGVGGDTLTTPIYMNGSFEFPHVRPGSYLAEVVPRIPAAVPAMLQVDASGLGDVEIRVPATADMTGRVTVENDGPMPRGLEFVVAGAKISVPLQPDGRFIVTLPEGGNLSLAPESLPSGYAVRAMTLGPLDLMHEPLRVASAENTLKLALASAATVAVRGRVAGTDPQRNTGHVWLSHSAGLLHTLESSVERDGAFGFSNVIPGTYTLRFSAPGAAAGPVTTITVTAEKDVAGIDVKP